MDAETLEFLDSLVREGVEVEGGIQIPTERRLAEVSGMSRARVRERLSGLQMLGMLRKVQGSGNVLVTPSFDGGSGNVFELMLRAGMVTVAQIAEAREMLEVAMAPRMVERVTDQQIHQLEDLVYAMVDASANRDFVGGLEADHAFHIALFEILGNPIMSYVVNGMNHALHDLLLERRRVAIGKEIAANGGEVPEMFASDSVHFEITRALRSRRREAVASAMSEHFDRWRRISRTPTRAAAVAAGSQTAASATSSAANPAAPSGAQAAGASAPSAAGPSAAPPVGPSAAKPAAPSAASAAGPATPSAP